MNGRRVALAGILTALGLVLGYVESLLPVFGFPGMKIGLGNLVVMVAAYIIGAGAAIVVNLVRIILTAMLFGSMVSLWYALAGGTFSLLVMLLLKNIGHFHVLPVSMAAAIAHNVGQLLVAMLLIGTKAILWYMVVLWFSGMIFGAAIGLIAGIVIKRMNGIVKNED